VKKAVIVVGGHHAAKSKTIRDYLKPMVGISGNRRQFQLGEHEGAVFSQSLEERSGNGHVLSQSLEETGLANVGEIVERLQCYERLVFAARSTKRTPSTGH